MQYWIFERGSYTCRIYAYDKYAAEQIWKNLEVRNYYPTSGKVRQTSHDFDYEICF